MHMRVQLNMFEALTEAGIKPDSARNVERQVEAAIENGQAAIRAEMKDQFMSRSDGRELKAGFKAEFQEVRSDLAQMETRFLKAMNEQTWKLVSFVIVCNGAMLAIAKYLG